MKQWIVRNNASKNQMRMSYQSIGYDSLFPSSSLAFCSGATGNIIYQSFLSLYRSFLYKIYPELRVPITCGLKNVLSAGIVTSSYMLYIKAMHCGDFSFKVDLSKRYIGGYGAGVTAVLFLNIIDSIHAGMKQGFKGISWKSILCTFMSQLLTLAPLIMVQQSFYDHLRILEDPYIKPSCFTFFSTGLITGVAAQYLVQPLINLLSSSRKCFHPSFLWRSAFRNCLTTAPMMAISLTMRDVVLGRTSMSEYEKRCQRRHNLLEQTN